MVALITAERKVFYKRLGAALLVTIVAVATVLVLYGVATEAKIRSQIKRTDDMIATTDKALEVIRERKVAEKLREAEASQAAEQARTADGSSAGSIDSSKCNTSTNHNDPNKIDVMVNKKHCIQPLTFAPADLVTSNGATLSAKAIGAYNDMFRAAAAAGQGFYVTSSYRSYESQISTYNYWVGVSGRDGADTYSARPGYSEHQTGLVFDVGVNGCVLDCFGSTSQYQWLQNNAADFGFIQRYYAGSEAITGYKAEEWHYRYVGVPTAKDMRAKNIKTLEEYWSMPGGLY